MGYKDCDALVAPITTELFEKKWVFAVFAVLITAPAGSLRECWAKMKPTSWGVLVSLSQSLSILIFRVTDEVQLCVAL